MSCAGGIAGQRPATRSPSTTTAVAYAIAQPAGVDVGEVVVRPTAQS
ncbi:hypothetical protein ACTJKO_05815 [Curtobacterium sp. 22159]